LFPAKLPVSLHRVQVGIHADTISSERIITGIQSPRFIVIGPSFGGTGPTHIVDGIPLFNLLTLFYFGHIPTPACFNFVT
jgi:hypothetical protein